jgi:hypothetical protein
MDRVPVAFRVPEVAVPVSAALREYFLADDGMFLPADAFPPSGEVGEEEAEGHVAHDEAVESAVRDALARWGRVTLKVDDLAPIDCVWMMPFGSGCCATLGHVYMAVKASNRLQAHLERTVSATLRLQPWIGDSPAGEFRCFTSGDRLAFAGQRYPVNSVRTDLVELGRKLFALWRDSGLGKVVCGFWQVDVWLRDSDTELYILGVRAPVREEVESSGVFSFEELEAGSPDEEPCTVVRAITDERAMAARPRDGSGAPIDLHLYAGSAFSAGQNTP